MSMVDFVLGRAARRPSRRQPSCRPLTVEALEARALLASNPFASAAFNADLLKILQSYNTAQGGIPQVTLAMLQDGEVYTGGLTNPKFFSTKANETQLKILGNSQAVEPDSVFRIASAGKTFVAAAILSLQQEIRQIKNDPNYDLLDQPAFTLMGYTAGETISGFAPANPTQPISAVVPNQLFDITVRDLLHMRSGLDGDATVVGSQGFIDAKTGFLFSNEGSYATLQFTGPPPAGQGYQAPATVAQTFDYFVYQVSVGIPNVFTLENVGGPFDYQDINFEAGAYIVDRLAFEYGLAGNYGEYVSKFVLEPLGIQRPPAQGDPTTNALFGPEHSQQNQSFPTEITYYNDPSQEPKDYNVIPNPNAQQSPFYYHGKGQLVYEQYGGTNTNPDRNGGAVATPTAMVTFQDYISKVVMAGPNGNVGGPLTYDSVMELLSRPEGDTKPAQTYFALGLYVIPNPGDPTDLRQASWTKGGNIAGSLSQVQREANGIVTSVIFNAQPPTGNERGGLINDVRNLMLQYGQPIYLTTGPKSTPQKTKVNTAFPNLLWVRVQSKQGQSVAGRPITFTVHTAGPSGTFGQKHLKTITIKTGPQGWVGVKFTANGVSGRNYIVSAYNEDGGSVTFRLTNLKKQTSVAASPLATPVTTMANSDVDAAFTHELYRAVLGREARDAEVAVIVARLDAGALRLEVVSQVWASREHRVLQVGAFYEDYLGRAPSAIERAGWVARFMRGADESDVLRGILSSARLPGVENRVVSKAALARVVDECYGAFLGHPASAAERAAWIAALRAGTGYGSVAIGVLASREFLDALRV